jgi:hypothetical protein
VIKAQFGNALARVGRFDGFMTRSKPANIDRIQSPNDRRVQLTMFQGRNAGGVKSQCR